jgi:CheY-like chemotaxis protein
VKSCLSNIANLRIRRSLKEHQPLLHARVFAVVFFVSFATDDYKLCLTLTNGEPAMTEPALRAAPASPLNLLVVEDDEVLCRLLQTAFKNEHIVETTTSLKDGWDKYVQSAPNIVLIDIGLPDGMGHDLAFRIKKHNQAAFVAMATASESLNDREEAQFNRVDAYITKPISRQKVHDLIALYWSQRS